MKIECLDSLIEVIWENSHKSVYHYIWLRDNCTCCRHETTRHRTVETSTIPLDIKPEKVSVDNSLEILWKDGHKSSYSFDWLKKFDYSKSLSYIDNNVVLWKASDEESLPKFEYSFFEKKDENFKSNLVQMLEGFMRYGIIFIKNIPISYVDVTDIARAFGYIRETNWGKTYDVKSYANANSVAYTNLALFGHTDDPYRDPIASAQLSLFVKNDADGGESTLSDGFKIAEDIKKINPYYFELLCTTPIHFYLQDETNILQSVKTIIDLDPYGNIRTISYSNHSSQPFRVAPEKMADFYAAYHMFATMREDPKYKVKIKMKPGDLYMINNRRILHGRSEYSLSNGDRHINGCFIEIDQITSQFYHAKARKESYFKYWTKMTRY